MNPPPLESWAREEALREAARIVRRLPFEDYDRDVRPRLRRLTEGQRALVRDTLRRLSRSEGAADLPS
jgi:hypothetical protein